MFILLLPFAHLMGVKRGCFQDTYSFVISIWANAMDFLWFWYNKFIELDWVEKVNKLRGSNVTDVSIVATTMMVISALLLFYPAATKTWLSRIFLTVKCILGMILGTMVVWFILWQPTCHLLLMWKDDVMTSKRELGNQLFHLGTNLSAQIFFLTTVRFTQRDLWENTTEAAQNQRKYIWNFLCRIPVFGYLFRFIGFMVRRLFSPIGRVFKAIKMLKF